ncbi:MAG: AAA family ATPase [Hydrogenophaga sp.]|nr:AAA family ATPase [Hydrogenophaga sp.]
MMDTAKAIDALHSIPPDLTRDEWHRVGRAAIAAGLDVDELINWSRNAGNFKSEQDVRAAFRNITPEGGTGPGTLFHIAAEHGWNNGSSKPLRQPMRERARKAAEPPRKPAPGMSPAEVWNRCEAATVAHGYIVSKAAAGVPLDGLRVVPAGDVLRIAGQSMAGALVVPAYGPQGLQSLQLIPPPGEGKKLNLPGAPMAGASFTVGDVVPGALLYVCEGIGAAWACWQATGHPAVVCFGWGNVGKVAADFRQRDASARLVLVPDVGKEESAAEIAQAVCAAVAYMPQGKANNFDANDLAQRDGFDVLAVLLESATEPPKPEPLLKPVSVFDVLTNPAPPPAFVWDDYLPRGVVALWGAHGGTGKSTCALMLTVAVVTGRPLFGVATTEAPAVFVSLEDGANIVRHRLAVICRAWGIDPRSLADRLHIVDGTENPELFAADARSAGNVTAAYLELSRLVEETRAGLVVVDNASDSFGGDEINRRQVRGFMRALVQVARLTDCAVCLLAHVDKGTSRNKKAEGGEGYSGSTAWHNSARSRLFMTRGDDGLLTLEHQKSNLGKRREPIALEWPEHGLPTLINDAPNFDGLNARTQGRADDEKAAALLALIAEFEGREQYASPAAQARNNVHALLRVEPAFQRLKLNRDATARIVNQCQRAGWLESLDYRSPDRKPRQRWTVSQKGREFAGLPAPTAPTAPTCDDSAQSAASSIGGAPTAPTYVGGVGDRARTHVGANEAEVCNGC